MATLVVDEPQRAVALHEPQDRLHHVAPWSPHTHEVRATAAPVPRADAHAHRGAWSGRTPSVVQECPTRRTESASRRRTRSPSPATRCAPRGRKPRRPTARRDRSPGVHGRGHPRRHRRRSRRRSGSRRPAPRRHDAEDGIAVGDVGMGPVDPEHVVTGRTQASTTSRPSCPAAPVTSTLMASARRVTSKRGAAFSGSHHQRLSRYHATSTRVPRRRSAGRTPERRDLVDRDRVAAVVAEAVLDRHDRALVPAGQLEQSVRDLAVRDLVVRDDVVDLADGALAQAPGRRRGCGPRRGSSRGCCRRRRRAARSDRRAGSS